MKLQDFLTEGKNTPVVIVDIQPAYDKPAGNVPERLMSFLNKQTGPILAFFNGEDFGLDSKREVQYYYLENGLSEDKLSDIKFREKVYAWFRPMIDIGTSEKTMIKIIRHLATNRIHDSRELNDTEWTKLLGADVYENLRSALQDDGVYIPDISLGELKKYSGCYLAGGGKHKCLLEFKILLDAFNIKYKLMRQFIY